MRSLLVEGTMMATASSSLAEDVSADANKFLIIALKCPVENDGLFELVSANKLGQRSRLRVTYETTTATTALYSIARPGEDFMDWRLIHVGKESDPDFAEIGAKLAARADEVIAAACLAPEATREAYFDTLKANRKTLGLP